MVRRLRQGERGRGTATRNTRMPREHVAAFRLPHSACMQREQPQLHQPPASMLIAHTLVVTGQPLGLQMRGLRGQVPELRAADRQQSPLVRRLQARPLGLGDSEQEDVPVLREEGLVRDGGGRPAQVVRSQTGWCTCLRSDSNSSMLTQPARVPGARTAPKSSTRKRSRSRRRAPPKSASSAVTRRRCDRIAPPPPIPSPIFPRATTQRRGIATHTMMPWPLQSFGLNDGTNKRRWCKPCADTKPESVPMSGRHSAQDKRDDIAKQILELGAPPSVPAAPACPVLPCPCSCRVAPILSWLRVLLLL